MARRKSAKDMLARVPEKLRAIIGVLLAGGAAYGLGQLFEAHHAKVFLPLWFVAVLVALALRYGMAVGVIGSLLSAAIFAITLFSPQGSLWISDLTARRNLAWMVLGGVVLSYLFAPSGSAHRKS
jgi:K+-sensing histidine kinase KdpD